MPYGDPLPPPEPGQPSGEPSDLHLPLRDSRRGLRQTGQPYWVPLSRVCQFLRQAGLLPRALSKLITELQQASGRLRVGVRLRVG